MRGTSKCLKNTMIFWFFWNSFTSLYGLCGAKSAENGQSFLLLLLNGWRYGPFVYVSASADAREYSV
jgi:hypothetical protein